MGNDVVKKVDDNLTNFNSLNYRDKKFVQGIILGEKSKKKLAKKIYYIDDDDEAEIKAMTTLARKDISNAISEFNSIQLGLFKAKIINKSEEAIDKQVHIMRNGIEEQNRLKAANNISKLGMDVVKEETKKNENRSMKIIIENPGSVKIDFGSDQIAKSFMNIKKEDIIDAEIEEIEEVKKDE